MKNWSTKVASGKMKARGEFFGRRGDFFNERRKTLILNLVLQWTIKKCNGTLGRSKLFLQRRSRQSASCEILNPLSTGSNIFWYFVVWLAFGALEFHGFVGGELRSVLPTWVWRAWILSGSHTSEIAFSQRRCWKNANSKRHYWREYDCRTHSSSRRVQKMRIA